MHINVLLTELAMHLIWHFVLEMAVGVYFIFTQLRGICTSHCCHIPARKDVRNATMGQNNNQSLTPNNNAEFNLLFRSVIRDGPVQ